MIPDDLDPLEQHLLAAFETLEPGARSCRSIRMPRRSGARRSRAGTAITRRAGSRRSGARSTRSDRRGTRATRRSHCASRPTDPALLHYRSGAFYLARAGQAGRDGVPDVMQGVAAAIDEPIAGGRHKVFGNHELAVIPQTSTIASHLPRAVGVAIAIDRARKLGVECRVAGRRDRRLQLRRRLAEPRDRPGRAQHDGARGAPAPPGAVALRL